MIKPLSILKQWLSEEQGMGAPNPQQAVLSTITQKTDRPLAVRSRVVAIREISPKGFIFFTQKGTQKVSDLIANPNAAMTFWFELYQREVIIDGKVEPLSKTENDHYWQSYPREAQIRFYSYAPTSSQPIINKQVLEDRRKAIEDTYQTNPLPLNPFYLGFRLKPTRMVFYAYRTDELSDVFEYQQVDGNWIYELLSP